MRKVLVCVGLATFLIMATFASRQARGSGGEPETIDARRVKRCAASTLKGAFGVKFEGLSLTLGPLVSVARFTFDGKGEFTSKEVARINGELVERTFMGPYTVNRDCTGFLDFSSDINASGIVRGDFVIVNDGNEFFLLDNEDGWVANGVGKRL